MERHPPRYVVALARIGLKRILSQLGLSSSQAINILFAQIERRRALPFPIALEPNSDILPPIEHVAHVWNQLDQEDFSYLDKR